jgi:hypothetical protein
MPIDWFIFAGVYILWRKRKGKRQKYHIQMLVHWLLFPRVSYCDSRERVFMFDYDTKEKEHKKARQSDLYSGATPPRTNQIASCFGALSITYTLALWLSSIKLFKKCTSKKIFDRIFICSLLNDDQHYGCR